MKKVFRREITSILNGIDSAEKSLPKIKLYKEFDTYAIDLQVLSNRKEKNEPNYLFEWFNE